MAANVETMMYVREKPWHGLGTRVEEAPTSADALRLAGLDWTVDRHDVILSRLVDTFSSRILYPMLLLSGNHSIAAVLSWEEGLH